MKRRCKVLLIFILFLVLVFFPKNVIAADKKECSYKVVGDSLTGTSSGELKCSLSYKSGFLGGLAYSCKYTSNDKSYTVLIVNATKEKKTGFNLENYFKEKKSCPKYMIFNTKEPAGYSAYASNSDETTNKILKLDKAKGAWQIIVEKGSEKDKDVVEKNCGQYKNHLDNIIGNLEDQVAKSKKLKCPSFKISQKEREKVISADHANQARECDTVLTASIMLSNNAQTELDSYVEKGCLSKNSNEYRTYQDKFLAFKATAEEVKKNKDEQLSSSYEEEDDDIGFVDTDQDQDCQSILGRTDDENSVAWLLMKFLNYVKIIGPVLVILLSSFDFVKAIISSDEDAMKKAQKKFIFRLVLAIAVFFVPLLVGVLLEITGIVNSDPTCGLDIVS